MNDDIPALSVRELSKSFAGTQALSEVSLDFLRGSITALLGQNGSGKSTLIKALAGFHAPDGGSVAVGGVDLPVPISPQTAYERGLRFVHQDIALVEQMSVADNLGFTLGFNARTSVGHISRRALRKRARAALDRVGVDTPPDALVSELPPTERMLVAIARAFEGAADNAEHRILVLDEPTAALPAADVDRVLKILERVRSLGGTVIYVTHRIDEVMRIADHLAILRDGRLVTSEPLGEHDAHALATLIVGRAVERGFQARERDIGADVRMEVRGLSGPRITDVSFELRSGEIMGVTGLLGCGRSELARLITGVQQPYAGEILLDGETVELSEPRDGLDHGIGFVPPDRRRHGCILDLGLRENLTLGDLAPYWQGGRINRSKERNDVAELIKSFDIRPPLPDRPIRHFSGGNQQKAVIAKFARLNPRLLVVDEPTQGVDVGGKREIGLALRRFADDGAGIIVASSDYDEISDLCDRVLVLDRGHMVGIFDSGDLSEQRLAVLGTQAGHNPEEQGQAT